MLSRVVPSVFFALACTGCRATTRVAADDASARVNFARLQSLAGTWVTVQEDGTQPAGQYAYQRAVDLRERPGFVHRADARRRNGPEL